MAKIYTIGIDPGTNTGVAWFDRLTGRIVRAETLDFGRTLALLDAEYSPDCCDLIVEDASLNRPTFRRSNDPRRQDRMSRNVGFVQRESRLLIAELRRRGYTVMTVRPCSAKWNAEMVKRIARWDKRCSQHSRDAIALCWGIRVVRVESRST
jgi:hypothetical protein